MIRLSLFLLLVVQGVRSQLFSIEPREENVVNKGDSVTLECVLLEPASLCTWKLMGTQLGTDGFLTRNIPSSIDITARDPDSDTDCSITINTIDSRYDGEYVCSPFVQSGAQEDARKARVMTAHKPMSLEFVGEQAGRTVLTASSDRPVSVTCEARQSRPAAEVHWYLDNVQLYDDIVDSQLGNASFELLTTRSVLTRQFSRGENGARLRCVAAHIGYSEQDEREVSLVVDVTYAPYRPGGNEIGTLYGFTDGQEAVISVNFTANPQPSMVKWFIGEEPLQTGGVLQGGRFSARDITVLDADKGEYSVSLMINPIRLEDQMTKFRLLVENDDGDADMAFNLSTGPAPPSEGLSTGALGGIIIIVLLLLLIIVLVAYARSRGKWCFAAAKSTEETTEADGGAINGVKPEKKPFNLSAFCSSLMTKKPKEADVEMGDNKEEPKEVTKLSEDMDGKVSPDGQKKTGDVVYAELMLDSDGAKTEVRPSDEKTEYAVIVGTKKDGDQTEQQ